MQGKGIAKRSARNTGCQFAARKSVCVRFECIAIRALYFSLMTSPCSAGMICICRLAFTNPGINFISLEFPETAYFVGGHFLALDPLVDCVPLYPDVRSYRVDGQPAITGYFVHLNLRLLESIDSQKTGACPMHHTAN